MEAGMGVFLLIGLLLLGCLYFLPSVIALVRTHHQTGAILAINILLGWTLLGWVVAFAMSLSAKRPPYPAVGYGMHPGQQPMLYAPPHLVPYSTQGFPPPLQQAPSVGAQQPWPGMQPPR